MAKHWNDIKDAHARMTRARRKLFQKPAAQFWGVLGLGMALVPDDTCETMATDARSIFYSPAYVMSLTEDECIFVIAHEISHPALDHFRRKETRDHEMWNMAGDYELNPYLVSAGLTPPQGLLNDARFTGLSAEQIYSVIEKENQQARDKGQPEPHQKGSGNMRQPTNEDGSPMSAEEVDQLMADFQQKTNQALGAARKAGQMAGGAVPSHLVNVTDTRAHHFPMDWRQPLRAFIDALGSRQDTWASLSRRGMSYGMAYPGEQVIRPSRLAWLIDVSGSIDRAKNRQALAEAQAALDDLAVDAIDLIYVDTAIKGIDTYEAGDTIILKDGTGGGTDFASAMAWLTDASDRDY